MLLQIECLQGGPVRRRCGGRGIEGSGLVGCDWCGVMRGVRVYDDRGDRVWWWWGGGSGVVSGVGRVDESWWRRYDKVRSCECDNTINEDFCAGSEQLCNT